MAHCPPEALDDIGDVLDAVRAWDGIKEKSFACFYLKAKGFLHFHVKDGERWADVRCGKAWGEPIPLAPGASRPARMAFLKAARRYYEATIAVL
jgi:hypothetical protein